MSQPCNNCVHCAQSSQDHRNYQCSTMLHGAYLHSQVSVLRQLLSMFLANVAISRTADINKETCVCLLISETDVWTIGFDPPGSGDGGIPHHSNVICLHKPITIKPENCVYIILCDVVQITPSTLLCGFKLCDWQPCTLIQLFITNC